MAELSDKLAPYAVRCAANGGFALMKLIDGIYHDMGTFVNRFGAEYAARLMCENEALPCTSAPETDE